VAKEKPEFVWASSARGRRIPKRPTGRSEPPVRGVKFPPEGSERLPSGSQHPPRGSEHLPPGAPSTSNKIHGTRSNEEIHEEAIRSTLPSGHVNNFSFDIE